MGINADGVSAEGVAKNDVGGFSADARQREQFVQLIGNFAAEAFDDLVAASLNRL